ncbi:MAG: PIN domain-containing protein [Mycobacteriales bacterium]
MPALPAGSVLADASFLIAVADQEADAARFVPILQRCLITSVNFGEVLYKLAQKARMPAARTEQVFVHALGVVVEGVQLSDVRTFPELKTVDAASRAAQLSAGVAAVKSLSLADLTCLGVAAARGLPVLTGDKHWTTLGAHGLPVQIFDFRDRSVVS